MSVGLACVLVIAGRIRISFVGANVYVGTAESCFEYDALRQLCFLPQTCRYPNAHLQLSLRLIPRSRFDLDAGEERCALRKCVCSVAYICVVCGSQAIVEGLETRRRAVRVGEGKVGFTFDGGGFV